MTKPLLIRTDLDRTLIPDGQQIESPDARQRTAALVAQPWIRLGFGSGRHRALGEQAITDYRLPVPDYVVGDVGTSIYHLGPRHDWHGEEVPWEATGDTWTDGVGRTFDVYVEHLPGCSHLVLDDPQRDFGDMAELTVKPGRYLFMGDNRDNSHDGRKFGTVRLEELAGPAGLLYWSWDWTGSWLSLLNPLTWIENLSSKTRWGRMGRFRECLPEGS